MNFMTAWRARRAAKAYLSQTVKPCVWCGGKEALIVRVDVIPDFDPALLDPGLRKAFLSKQTGYCTTCGLYQDFNRLDISHLRALNGLSKDILTSEAAYERYPPPPDFVAEFNDRHYGLRLDRWSTYFEREKIQIRRALFLRVWFGAAPQFISDRFGAETAGLDMSPACLRYAREHVPGFQALGGVINGVLEGPFLETGPYDAVFTFHVLNHSCDVIAALRQLRGLLRPGGIVVLTNEIGRKPTNPFHYVHPSEIQLRALLREQFDVVDRIDDCEAQFDPHTNPVTVRGDIPDLVARVRH